MRNVEIMWLIGKLRPDFRTIADFRKDNAKGIKLVFREFVGLCDRLKLYDKKTIAVDGSKFRAQNSDDKCYNAEILTKKIKNVNKHIAEYFDSMDQADSMETDEGLTAEQVKAALAELLSRKEKYEMYLGQLEESGETQILETDPQARRMRSKDGFHCYYNVQTAVDSANHMIAEYEVTNNCNDQGLLNKVCQQAKETLKTETIEAIADKGYESRKDILNCLMNGVIPNVSLRYDKRVRIFNIEYKESEISEEVYKSTKPEDIQRCLHAGVLPECYKDSTISIEKQELTTIGCFSRNDDDTVTCPMGNTLYKTKNKGQNTVYASREACRQCQNRCTESKNHKTVSFGPKTKHIAVVMYGNSEYEVIRPPDNHLVHNAFDRKNKPQAKVVIKIHEDKEKAIQRMSLVEHPFGTVKWYHGAHYLLCRGKEKATAELGLSFMAYNLKRAINLCGVKAIIEAINS